MKKALLYFVAFLIVLAMLALGNWQLKRADEKQVIQNYVNKQASVELDLNAKHVTSDNLYQQAFGSGTYLHEKSVLIDSQVYKGSVGYHVVTPFKIIGSSQIVLINSGWVPAGASRAVKPKTSLPEGVLKVSGRLQKPHSKPPIWNEQTQLLQGGAWQYLAIDEFAKIKDISSLSPLILELEPTLQGAGGFKRKWQVYDDTWINRHKAYALQWFSMAIAFIFMCLMLELRTRKSRKQSTVE
jgi:surfeit locus 1 family protein